MIKFAAVALLFIFSALTFAQHSSRMKSTSELARGYWPLEKSQPIIDKTQTIRLAPDLAQLTPGERKAVTKLLEVGQIFQALYEKQ